MHEVPHSIKVIEPIRCKVVVIVLIAGNTRDQLLLWVKSTTALMSSSQLVVSLSKSNRRKEQFGINSVNECKVVPLLMRVSIHPRYKVWRVKPFPPILHRPLSN